MNRPVSVGVVVVVIALAVLGTSGSAVMLGAAATPSGDPGTGIGTDTGTESQDLPADSLESLADPTSPTLHQDTEPEAVQHTQQTATQQYAPDSRDFDRTSFEISVHENGSATWTFRYEQRQLEEGGDEEEIDTRENFEEFAEEFESEETEFYQRFVERAQSLTEAGADTTGREMEATDFDRRAAVEGQLNPQGVVEMSFTWHEFANTEDDSLVVGDVFQSMYLHDDQSIVIEAGDGLAFQRVDPDPQHIEGTSLETATAVHWEGEQEFFQGHPQVILAASDDGSGSGASDSGITAVLGDRPGFLGLLLLALALGLGFVLAGAWYRSREDDAGFRARIPGLGTGTAPSDPSDPRSQPDTNGSPGRAGADGAPGVSPSPVDSDTATATNDSPAPDPLSEEDLLTDEDRVVELIRENGGRMKQVNIVDETGWSKSKVSMLLSEMEDDGTISKLRVGRENIISLEGFEPEATKSPFDE